MIFAYVSDGSSMQRAAVEIDHLPEQTVWFDLHEPSGAEVAAVEKLCGVALPTREDMVEIEVSSRLYSEDGADFMTASVVYGLERERPSFEPVTFILARRRLITLRYSDPKTFRIYASKLCRAPEQPHVERGAFEEPSGVEEKAPTADQILVGLLETIVDRVADLLELVSADLDAIADDIFRSSARKKPAGNDDFKTLLRRIGAAGDLASRTRESLATLDRLIPFLQLALDRRKPAKEVKPRLKAMSRDVSSLTDFVSFLSNKTTFLLDTTVGMISIEQNAIIKIFSVAAVAFLPPTLVASVYGMNFEKIPELSWEYGYPYALTLMALSAILPMIFFRWKNWL